MHSYPIWIRRVLVGKSLIYDEGCPGIISLMRKTTQTHSNHAQLVCHYPRHIIKPTTAWHNLAFASETVGHSHNSDISKVFFFHIMSPRNIFLLSCVGWWEEWLTLDTHISEDSRDHFIGLLIPFFLAKYFYFPLCKSEKNLSPYLFDGKRFGINVNKCN